MLTRKDVERYEFAAISYASVLALPMRTLWESPLPTLLGFIGTTAVRQGGPRRSIASSFP
jgi:hypothetical protein